MSGGEVTSLNISLPEELKNYIEEQAKGSYSTPSEYVRDLVRQDRRRRAKEQIDVLLAEGLASGKPVAAGRRFWSDLRREAGQKLRVRERRRK
jgi:antitoxin ParD1/3/4